MERYHLWQGQFIDDSALSLKLKNIGKELTPFLGQKLPLSLVVETLHAFSLRLVPGNGNGNGLYQKLLGILEENPSLPKEEAKEILSSLRHFFGRDELKKKLKREFQLPSLHDDPFDWERVPGDPDQSLFEGWAPVGVLAHVAPANALAVGVLSVMEGLLTGNINLLKTARIDSSFSAQVLYELGQCDSSGLLSSFLIVVNISSQETDFLRKALGCADAVAVWGGEEALRSVAALIPRTTRLIQWGPKISFAYFSKGTSEQDQNQNFEKLARDIVLMEQAACSSPQVLYCETDSMDELCSVAERMARILSQVSAEKPLFPPPARAETAEITNVTELCRLEEPLGLAKVYEEKDPLKEKSWRVLVENNSDLKTSPLFRTLWVKPLTAGQIVSTLGPFRSYLQTVGLSSGERDVVRFSELFLRAGATRITPVGHMHDSYSGEPHDGVYALPRYAKRVSLKLPFALEGVTVLSDLSPDFLNLNKASSSLPSEAQGKPLMGKEDFQKREIPEEGSDLFFKSGGSSGEPKLSRFTYDDYHFQMKCAAHGLVAAGLRPQKDRVMNLFFGGGLYGGFISFFSILEILGAKQFPMAAHMDLKMVGKTIVDFQVDTLLGMPSYMSLLFEENKELFRQHRVVKKILFGGEMWSSAQKKYFREEFGVETIRSAAYGSVDAGPLGYQCQECGEGVHHLFHRLQALEILKMDSDQEIEEIGEVGRLVFTSKARQYQEIHRYDIGDLGRKIPGKCPCGRSGERFQLLGRFGDVVKAGGSFINFQKMEDILREKGEFSGEAQVLLELDAVTGRDRMTLVMGSLPREEEGLRNLLLDHYTDLREVVEEGALLFAVTFKESKALERIAGSGKLKRILEKRNF